MKRSLRGQLKELFGNLPYVAEAYWHIRQKDQPIGGLTLSMVRDHLPEMIVQAQSARPTDAHNTPVLLFGMLNYWIGHTAMLAVTLAGMGYHPTLAYLPYAGWSQPLNRFDLRRERLYVRGVLQQMAGLVDLVDISEVLENMPLRPALPKILLDQVRQVSVYDTQYTQQRESIDEQGELFRLRWERNLAAAQWMTAWLQARPAAQRPQAVIIPNGTIMEFGAVYHAVRSQGIDAVTYEFGEQRQRIWFAKNDQVMRQDTRQLWAALGDQPLAADQLEQVQALFASRQKASLWQNFARLWQNTPSEGGAAVRQRLKLDQRPVALLAANVIGDSLTLGRQVFTRDMTEWLIETVRAFSQQQSMQLVVRIHPGERYIQGVSVADVIHENFPNLPEHIHLVTFDAPVNTYDLIQAADMGMVYTTTTGLEMAMSGLPVIVVGETHYRGKGFTHDPSSWQELHALLKQAWTDGLPRPAREKTGRAWAYAYRFFFDFPLPFPWHLGNMKGDLTEWPVARVLGPEGQTEFGAAFAGLTGTPRPWQLGSPAVHAQAGISGGSDGLV